MSWPRLAGVTEIELVGVCESFRCDDSYGWDDVHIQASDGSYDDWDDVTDEDKASTDLKELLVLSADCDRYVLSQNQSSD